MVHLIFRVQNDCLLYGHYAKELQSNYEFNDRIKKFCQIFQCRKSDLNIEVVAEGPKKQKSLDLKIFFKDGRKIGNYDFSNVNLEDLAIAPREFHQSNINKYLTSDIAENLKNPLIYEYFWLDDKLYVEVADVKTPIKFKLLGIEKVDPTEERIIIHVRDMIDDLL